MFFILALPFTVVGEVIGEGLWRNPLAKRVEEQTSESSFLWLRIIYGFFAMLLVFAAAWAVVLFFGVEGSLARMREAGMRVATVATGADPSHAPARRAYEKAGFTVQIPVVWFCRKL